MPPIKKLAVVPNLYFYRSPYSRERLVCVACKKPLDNSLVKIVDKVMFHENCNQLQPNTEVELLQHNLEQTTLLRLQNETQKVQQLTEANLKLLDEIKIYQQQNQRPKFDDFRSCEQKKISATVRLRLLEFCSAELGATLIINDFTVSNLVAAVVNAIQDSPQLLFLWNLFYEQLSYVLLCPKCYLNSPTLSRLIETCTKHQAILANFNGKYYGGIFIGYAPPAKNKVIIQWFEDNSFSVMNVDTCYELTNLTVVPEDKSIEHAIIYNTRSTTKFRADFPQLLTL